LIAILPAAGKGKRMESVTAGAPKELLRVGGVPVLQRALDEAKAVGATSCVLVVSPDKPAFDREDCTNVVQQIPNGLAPAVALAARFGPVLVVLPDTIFFPSSPLPGLVRGLNQGFDFVLAVERVADEQVSRYGIVEWNPENGRIFRILEKPQPSQTASRWAIAARFGLSTRTLFFIRSRVDGWTGEGEIDLPPLLNEALAAGHAGLAVPLDPGQQRLDCGNPQGYRRACEVFDAGH
jgi:UTP-glucose-1-phosphate uridylyltransferase